MSNWFNPSFTRDWFNLKINLRVNFNIINLTYLGIVNLKANIALGIFLTRSSLDFVFRFKCFSVLVPCKSTKPTE